MLQPWRTGTVIRIMDETPTTRRFWIEIAELERFDFQPGQFVTIDLPIHEKPNKRWRSYSIASGPSQDNVFELVIVRMQDGAGTAYLFEEVIEGTQLKVRGPQGVFVLQQPVATDIMLICTGTGIAPFRSMLQYIESEQLPHGLVDLVFGTRTQADLLYRKEMEALENTLSGFRYHPVLSREDWSGNRGYVHSVYQRLLAERKQAAGLAEGERLPVQFYLCGWRNMIDESKQWLLDQGYGKQDIILEIYG